MLFPGAPVGRKNLAVVLRVMAAAEKSSAVGKARLDISGARAEEFPRLAAQVRSLGLEDRVRWLGRVPAEEMPALVSRAALVVYPSLYEGFGFPPLEAMAAGTPVVASDRGSLPEVLGEAALLVDPEDGRALTEALEAVLTRAELRARLRGAGLARARPFSWERCAAATTEVYREVAAAGQGRS
jgi:alpha-1,3-rhamnosyl/mannosyltransferase